MVAIYNICKYTHTYVSNFVQYLYVHMCEKILNANIAKIFIFFHQAFLCPYNFISIHFNILLLIFIVDGKLEHPPLDDERAFRREIEVMKSVEPHPNIVGIIGHCTKPSHQMLLLTEYCSFGNLLDFLR